MQTESIQRKQPPASDRSRDQARRAGRGRTSRARAGPERRASGRPGPASRLNVHPVVPDHRRLAGERAQRAGRPTGAPGPAWSAPRRRASAEHHGAGRTVPAGRRRPARQLRVTTPTLTPRALNVRQQRIRPRQQARVRAHPRLPGLPAAANARRRKAAPSPPRAVTSSGGGLHHAQNVLAVRRHSPARPPPAPSPPSPASSPENQCASQPASRPDQTARRGMM